MLLPQEAAAFLAIGEQEFNPAKSRMQGAVLPLGWSRSHSHYHGTLRSATDRILAKAHVRGKENKALP